MRNHGTPPKRLRGYLNEEPALKRLAARSRGLGEAQRRIQAALPSELAGCWQLARVDATRVTISATSSAWASRLRFYRGAILGAAADYVGKAPRECRFVVQTPPRQGRRKPARLSTGAAASIASAASTAANPRLCAALRRLASRGRNASDADQ